jgi:modulator of FtsH protease HflK
VRRNNEGANSIQNWVDNIDWQHQNWSRHFFVVGLLTATVLMVWGGSKSIYTVQPEGQSVVKRFGKVIATKPPGLHFKLPFGIDTQTFVPTARVLKQEFGFGSLEKGQTKGTNYRKNTADHAESLMLTGDLKVVDVEWVVQYRVDDPDKYLHSVRDVSGTIRDVSEAVNRRIVGNSLGSDVLTVKRVQIALAAKQELQQILNSFDMGITIGTVELQDVTPPDPVKPAFNEVNQSEQEKEQMINEAEKRRNQVVPRARGEARQVLEAAEGYRAERVNRATGEAARFLSIVEEYRNAPDVTRRRMYLEMLDRVLPELGRVIVVEEGQMNPIPLLNLDGPSIGVPSGTTRAPGSTQGSTPAPARRGANQ